MPRTPSDQRPQSCTQFHCQRSYLRCVWVSGCPHTKTGLSDFSAVLGAARVLWPSWTHFTDSAAEYSVGMFVNVWFYLGRNEGGEKKSNRGVKLGILIITRSFLFPSALNREKKVCGIIRVSPLNCTRNKVHGWATLSVKAPKNRFQNITVKNTSKQNCHRLFVKKPKCKYFCIHYQILCYPLKHLVYSFVYLPRACRHFVYIPPIQGCFTIQNDVKHAHLIYYLVIFPLIKHIFDSHWCDPDIAFPLFSL